MLSCLNKEFQYDTSVNTDIRRRFKRIQEQQEATGDAAKAEAAKRAKAAQDAIDAANCAQVDSIFAKRREARA